MTNTLTWLHLSDLHLTCKNDEHDWTTKSINQDIVIHSLLRDIKKLLIDKSQKPDLIFITGDLVYGGKEKEYQVAKEFCNQLLEITGLSKQQLFIIPGNHDVNRNEVKKSHTKSWYPFEDQDGISDILCDTDLAPILMRKFANFYKFYNDFFEQKREFKNHYTIAKSIDIVETDSTISLLGLNSALFSGYDGDDNKKLAFGSHQSEQAFQTQNSDSVLSIAFFHHPFSCFHACEESIQNQIKQHADIILTGHLHDPSNMSQHDGAGKVVIIGAGASYETRDSDNSFNLGVLNLETGEGKVQFYKYLNRSNRWTKNTDINLDDGDDGQFPFIISSIQDKVITLTDRKDEKASSIEQNKEIENKQQSPSSTAPKLPSKQVIAPIKIAILTANPINKKYDYSELLHGIRKLKCNVHYHYLNCDTLNDFDDYDYIFIMTKLIKNKVVIEDEYLGSRTVSLKELEDNIANTNIKGLFYFLDQEIAPEFISELSLPTIIYPLLSKNEINKLIFKSFKKHEITSIYALLKLLLRNETRNGAHA